MRLSGAVQAVNGFGRDLDRCIKAEAEVGSAQIVVDRFRNADRVIAGVAEKVRTMTASQLIQRLDRAGVPCGIVKSVLESLAEVSASPLTGIAPSVPGSVRLPPPGLDEHRAEIMSFGWDSFS